MNKTRKEILLNSLIASIGLFMFGFGVYLTIQANLGVAPWDSFSLGLANTFNVKYGTASIALSLFILVIDIIMKGKIGIGMFLDAFIVGKTVDLFNLLNIVPTQTELVYKLLVILIGMTIMGFSQYLYMKAGLGCGPRDTMLVGLSRRIKKVPIGVVSIAILATVTLLGLLLGGPIGIGTLICAGLIGPIMQFAFKLMHFDATKIEHQSISNSFKIIFRKTGE